MNRSILSLTALLVVANIKAQVDGPVLFLAQQDRAITENSSLQLQRRQVQCYGEMVYSLFSEKDHILHAYRVDAKGSVKSRVLDFKYQEREEDLSILALFMAEDRPSILFRIWEKKTGLVKLFVRAFDPTTLESIDAPALIGQIPFDPKSYQGIGPNVQIQQSPDGKKQLFYFDNIKENEMQLVMCWVTDNDFQAIWNGVYRIPVQSYGFSAKMLFSDDAAVYIKVSAIGITDDNIKEKSDGNLTVKVSKDYSKFDMFFYKLRGEEFLSWDGTLPDNIDCKNIELALVGDKVYYAAAASQKSDPDRITEIYRGIMNEQFLPDAPAYTSLEDINHYLRYLKHYVMDDEGNSFILTKVKNKNKIVVISFDNTDAVKWNNLFELEPVEWDGVVKYDVFIYAGKFRIARMAHHDQAGRETDGKLCNDGNASFGFPILITFDSEGRTRCEALVNKSDRGQRLISRRPDFSNIARCGAFVDWAYKNKDRLDIGVVRVPVR